MRSTDKTDKTDKEDMMTAIRVGGLVINKIVEMESGLPMSMVMPGVTADDLARLRTWYWDDSLSPDPAAANFTLSVHSYVVQVDGKTILIDSCNGNDKDRSIPFAHRLDTPWLDRLRALGIAPEDIDMVMCTHLHADHVGWNTRRDGDRWVPTFPNARYILGKKDYAFFSEQDHEVFHREAYLDSILPVVEAGQADIVDEDVAVHREIGDGIWLRPAFGHSPGCCMISAQRDGPTALFSGDVLHHPVQMVRPDLPFFADWDGALASQVRSSLLEEIAETDTVLLPAHFRGRSAGHVHRDGDAYRFRFLPE